MKNIIFVTVLMGLFLLLFTPQSIAQEKWIPLFNGKDLSAWEKKGNDAEYKVEGNQVIGISKYGGSTYLCTKTMYSDFILEVDVKIELGLNSGIQFRSNAGEHHKIKGVHGYQAEIDPSDRAWSGGIFDQSRRKWLYPLSINEPGRKAFKNGQWNKYRIEAIGNTLRIWVNGIQTSNLIDDMTAEGFIGLQIHGIKSKDLEGLTVRWRDARIMTENLEANKLPVSSHAPEISFLKNENNTP